MNAEIQQYVHDQLDPLRESIRALAQSVMDLQQQLANLQALKQAPPPVPGA